jgi:hypothetical protein
MNLDQIIGEVILAAVEADQIKAVDGVIAACHVLVRHAPACHARMTRGGSECSCGDSIRITVHAGESADCAVCRELARAH